MRLLSRSHQFWGRHRYSDGYHPSVRVYGRTKQGALSAALFVGDTGIIKIVGTVIPAVVRIAVHNYYPSGTGRKFQFGKSLWHE
jgi:hypothetical protein